VKPRAAAHERRRGPADIRAVDAEPGALGHRPEAAVGALFAFLRALYASVDAALIRLGWHTLSLSFLLVNRHPGYFLTNVAGDLSNFSLSAFEQK
jgi:hypothetical protein